MEDIIKTITPLVSALVIILLGQLSKKYEFVNKNLLPIQNNIIALVIALIEYVLTKDFNYLTVASGLFASGMYDIFHGAKKTSYVDEIETQNVEMPDYIDDEDQQLENNESSENEVNEYDDVQG